MISTQTFARKRLCAVVGAASRVRKIPATRKASQDFAMRRGGFGSPKP
jgi:hypothetical protein